MNKPKLSLNPNSGVTISLASPDTILNNSYGEVINAETINYRSLKPEMDGLFCEKIFGPSKDYECHCRKYRGIRYKSIICDRCGVELARRTVRRERTGHIHLQIPVVHIWYYRSSPNKIAYLLDYTSKELEKIIYYESFVVISPGKAREEGVYAGQLISEEERMEYEEKYGASPKSKPLFADQSSTYDEDTLVIRDGAEAIEELIRKIDLNKEAYKLRQELREETSQMRKKKKLKKLQIVEAFRTARHRSLSDPLWMILRVLPVIPPELRPLVPLAGGYFAASDLNDLYRRVIIRNNRLKRLLQIDAPRVILRNEKRILQESVDSLFENAKGESVAFSTSKRPLKSISENLNGKTGRFRMNLLGKRVDYSGRSVIVVGPELKMQECGLPKHMAIELFKPFVIQGLIQRGYVKTVRNARKVIARNDYVIWEVLENVTKGHPILLNRAPTLHRLGIQAYQPVLIEEKAIRLHPLSCAAFNADFDGDQMAVHVPLGDDSIIEASVLMLGAHNILSPANGDPVVVPSQDMVLGIYYLTKMYNNSTEAKHHFLSFEDVVIALNHGVIDIHSPIKVKCELDDNKNNAVAEDGYIYTSAGRVLFNMIFPKEIGYINNTLGKKELRKIIIDVHKNVSAAQTAEFLDKIKDLGFRYATLGGISFSLEDVVVPKTKQEIILKAQKEVQEIASHYQLGLITDNERYNQVIDKWTSITNHISELLFNGLKTHKEGFNPVYMMADSGARGSREQIRQLGGIRGLMAKPQRSSSKDNEVIENPIFSSFKEGLSILEYFISTHGARKGLADTALKTADAGYLTRRLVDVSQDIIVNIKDCGTLRGLHVTALKDNEDIIESLEDRIIGRVSLDDIYHPITNELICEANQLINEDIASKIGETSIEEVRIRSVLTCEAEQGVCAYCYGYDLARRRMVQIGEAVGVIAAQSIGEPGTQLTLRTFHIGGTASRMETESQQTVKFDGVVKFKNIKYALYKPKDGEEESVVISRIGEISILNEEGLELISYNVLYGARLLVKEGQKVKKNDILCKWDPYNALILAEYDGKIKFHDIIDGVTCSEDIDMQTGHREKVIIESKDKTLLPRFVIYTKDKKEIDINIPVGAHLVVDDNQNVLQGQTLAKITRTTARSRDITAGLPRVTELFEARLPVDPAIVSEINGVVKMGKIKRGSREVFINPPEKDIESHKYTIPVTKHILVQENDYVTAGQRLSDGNISAQQILDILGVNAVQSYLVNEIQEVYRLQGVRINDKHIETIVRAMMYKVVVDDPGDTKYIEGDIVNRSVINVVNNGINGKLIVENAGDSDLKEGHIIGKKDAYKINKTLLMEDKKELKTREARIATSKSLLLGITRSSLSTDSWLSAASFQETTKVLAQAAIEAKVDPLIGLKENVIFGRKVPAGTGNRKYEDIVVGHVEHASYEVEDTSDNTPESGRTENVSEAYK